jgi:stage V sporulation protein R
LVSSTVGISSRTYTIKLTIDSFKAHGDRIRNYIEDPSIGLDKVEGLLDAAHSISRQCQSNLAIRKRTHDEERKVLIESAIPRYDPFRHIHRRKPPIEPNLKKIPPVADEDLLLFIRDQNPNLAEWEKDLLTIVYEEARYFIPQIETKTMNEGWATYWHKKILDSLDLPQDLYLEFLVRHNQVIRPFDLGLNPYHIGLAVWLDIFRSSNDLSEEQAAETINTDNLGATNKLFEVRESDRDTSFLRRHLTEKLIRKLNLFEYVKKGELNVVQKIADQEGWRDVKETLIKNIGMNAVPMIKVEDGDFGHNHTLYLIHDHDGRDLHLEYAKKTLSHIKYLWQGNIVLETAISEKRHMLVYDDDGFSKKSLD